MLSLVKPEKSAPPAYPPVFTSVGGDLCQFVAVQEIPNFGLHGYYAISMEPLSKWSHASTNAAKKASTKPKHYVDCFKDSCKLVESTYRLKKSNDPDSPSSPPLQSSAIQQQPPESLEPSSQVPINSEMSNPSGNSQKENECEKIPTTQFIPLPPIPFQTFRKEIAGFESRPTWGRSRYIERLIDESPHMTADLNVSQADAMLHGISDKTFKKAENYGPCAISNNRQHVERMLDLPPCAVDPGELKPNPGPFYTCRPKREHTLETHTDICHNERDYYPCGKRNGYSLRGGSDSGSCDPKNQGSRSRTSISDSRRDGSIFDYTDDPLDVDTSIHDTTTARKYIDRETSGNFKWLEDMEHVHFSDPTDTSCAEFGSGSRRKPYSSDTMTNEFYQLETEACSEFDGRASINEQLQPKKLMPQVARQMQAPKLCQAQRSSHLAQQNPSRSPNSRSYAQPYWEQQMGLRQSNVAVIGEENSDEEDIEPSMAVVRRRIAKSREAMKREPEVHETSYRWKEIIDQTTPSRDETSRSEDSERMSSRDLEYLEYLEASKTDCGICYEDDEEEVEAPRYSSRVTRQTFDGNTTKKLLRPPKATPSPGRVIMPLSKQNLRRQAPPGSGSSNLQM